MSVGREKRICFISIGSIDGDPRALFLARSLKKLGFTVYGFNIWLNPLLCRNFKIRLRHRYQIYQEFDMEDVEFYRFCKIGLFWSSVFRYLKRRFFKFIPRTEDLSMCIEDMCPSFVHNFSRSKYAKKLKSADIIWGNELLMGGIIAERLAARLRKIFIIDVKEVYAKMSDDSTPAEIGLLERMEKLAFNRSAVLPCVSQKIIEYYSEKHPHCADKFVLLENSRPFEALPVKFEAKQDKIKIILTAGSGGDERGLIEFLKAWCLLDPENAVLHFRLKERPVERVQKYIEAAGETYQKSFFIIPKVLEDEMTLSLLGYDIGLIPYLKSNFNQLYCCPNKFGQYSSAGLAVLSSNTEYITKKIVTHDMGWIYDPLNTEGTANLLKGILAHRKEILEKRQNAYEFARDVYNWDLQVQPLLSMMQSKFMKDSLKVLLLYIKSGVMPQTTADGLNAFAHYSRHSYTYCHYNRRTSLPNFSAFDAIVVHYYGQVYWDFSARLIDALLGFKGLKVIFAQDEFDRLTKNREKYLAIQPHILYSVSARDEHMKERLYPKALFPNLEVRTCLTGYVNPDHDYRRTSTSQRPMHVFYRGNNQGYAYGKLGMEKQQIGLKMLEKLNAVEGIVADIKVRIEDQIYGEAYLEKMSQAKATLATEGGSTLIDDEGVLRTKIIDWCRVHPEATYEDVKAEFSDFYHEDGQYVSNLITPKVFEAILCKTVVICYQGDYCGILRDKENCLMLNKDWSNFEEILAWLRDDERLQALADAAYDDIVLSNRYSYETFLKEFDEVLVKGVNQLGSSIVSSDSLVAEHA